MKNFRVPNQGFKFLILLCGICCSIYQSAKAQALSPEEINQQDSSKTDPFRKRAYLGVEYGFAIPMGSFSAEFETPEKSAFAQNGSSLNLLKFGYRLTSNFYASGQYSILRNPLDERGIEKRLSARSNSQYQVEAKEYLLKVFLLGVGISKRSKSVDIDLRFLGGYGNASSPRLNILEKKNNGSTSQFQIPLEKQSGFGGALSMGLRIHLNEYLDFSSSAAYYIFEKNFEQLNLNQGQSSNISYEILNLTFGICYRFIPEKLKP